MDLKTLKDIPSSFSLAKRSLVICLVVSLVTTIGSLCWAYVISKTFTESAFILTDDGRAALVKGVSAVEIDTYRKPEIANHIRTFHKLFWNVDQFSYERNTDNALYLIGSSGKEMYLSLKAQGHYSKIASQNLIQKIEIDSIHINDATTPYKATLYAKLKVNRTDQKSETTDNFSATFDIYNVTRTDKNPHGLLIENYNARTNQIKK